MISIVFSIFQVMFPSTMLSAFWKEIFEKEKLAVRMAEVAALKDNGLSLSPAVMGCIHLKVAPATNLGDNFGSDAYVVKALLEDGKELQSFVKANSDFVIKELFLDKNI